MIFQLAIYIVLLYFALCCGVGVVYAIGPFLNEAVEVGFRTWRWIGLAVFAVIAVATYTLGASWVVLAFIAFIAVGVFLADDY